LFLHPDEYVIMYVMRFRPGNPGVVLPEAYNAPLSFSVEHPWGTVYVTADGEDTYGLKPVLPTVTEGLTTFAERSLPSSMPPDRTDVLVCSPRELPAALDSDTCTVVALPGKECVEVINAPGLSRDTTDVSVGMQLSAFAAGHGVEPEAILFPGAHGEHVSQEVARESLVTHMIAQRLAVTTADTAARLLLEHGRTAYDAGLLKALRKFGIAGAVAVAGAESAALTLSDEASYLHSAVPIVVGITAFAGYRMVRGYLQNATVRENILDIRAQHIGQALSTGLHATFCSGTDPAGVVHH
jgi:hypothetical protein